MASSLGNYSDKEVRYKIVAASVRILTGLLLTWGIVVLSFHLPLVQAHYQGMTSFAFVGAIFTLILTPVWLALHFLILVRCRLFGKSAVAVLVPVALVSVLVLCGIYVCNEAWMAGL